MNYKRLYFNFLLLGCLFFLVKSSTAQVETFRSNIVPGRGATLINFVGNKNSFSFTVDGKSIKPVNDKGPQKYLNVDGRILQYLLVPFPEKRDYQNFSTQRKRDFLLSYEGFEMQNIRENLKVKDLHEKLKFYTLKGKLFLFWVYDMPRQRGQNIIQQCYLITESFNNMVVFNSPVQDDMTDVMNFLLDIGESFKSNSIK
jgi:hypothetical protein